MLLLLFDLHLMKTVVLALLFFSLKTNAQLLPLQNTLTTTTTPSTSSTPTSTLSTTSSSSSSASPTTSPRSSSTPSTTSASSTSSAPVISTASSIAAVTSPVVTSVDGTLLTTVVTVVAPSSPTSSSSQPTQSAPPQSDSGSGALSTGSIIGLSVAGGVAVIGLIAFFVWKLTRKRFSDFDDNEAIKWPDLNTHGGVTNDSHPLPVNNTGRTGFDTASENSLSRMDSNNYSTADFHSKPPYAAPLSRIDSNNYSTADFHSSDPYAVPPLPHLDPNQPYRDDPSAVGYYDPYRGPIPGTIEESYPMAQMSSGGRMSPGPNAAYSGEGRHSPGPQAAYGRALSPGPQAAYAGRKSPGPQAAYGGSISPVPPGYDAYGTR